MITHHFHDKRAIKFSKLYCLLSSIVSLYFITLFESGTPYSTFPVSVQGNLQMDLSYPAQIYVIIYIHRMHLWRIFTQQKEL